MQRIRELLTGVDELPDSLCRLAYRRGTATVTLPNGRSQSIEISRNDDGYLLSSKVIGATRAQSLEAGDLIELLWKRNADTGVVALTLDSAGRIVGRIQHDDEDLKLTELTYYLSTLAEECDRLEFLLTGRDER